MIKKFLKMLKIITERREETPNVNWVEINESNKKHYNNYVIPKLIWIYWDSETLPEIVRMCIEQVKKLCSDYEVMVLNENNVHNYITLPEVNGSLPKSNVADIIRLLLLKKYGGVWMDASIFLTEGLEWITSRMQNHEAFLFTQMNVRLTLINLSQKTGLSFALGKVISFRHGLESLKAVQPVTIQRIIMPT